MIYITLSVRKHSKTKIEVFLFLVSTFLGVAIFCAAILPLLSVHRSIAQQNLCISFGVIFRNSQSYQQQVPNLSTASRGC
jgi:hypothetical protein